MATTKLKTSIVDEDVTKEELSLVRSYLLLTFIHKVFERDCRVISKMVYLRPLSFIWSSCLVPLRKPH